MFVRAGDNRGTPVEAVRSTPGEAVQEEYGVSLRDLLAVFGRRLWMIVLVTVVCVGFVVGFDLLQRPIYEAQITILIGQEQGDTAPGTLGGDVQGLREITQTMTEAVNTRPVAEEVIRRLNLQESPEEFLGNLSAERVGETQFIEVAYRDPSSERARQIADTIGAVFSERVSEVSPSANSITATVWEEALAPESPVSPNPLRDGLLALVLGSILGMGLAFLLDLLDDRWRSPEEVEQVSGVPTFGVIPRVEVPKGTKKRA